MEAAGIFIKKSINKKQCLRMHKRSPAGSAVKVTQNESGHRYILGKNLEINLKEVLTVTIIISVHFLLVVIGFHLMTTLHVFLVFFCIQSSCAVAFLCAISMIHTFIEIFVKNMESHCEDLIWIRIIYVEDEAMKI